MSTSAASSRSFPATSAVRDQLDRVLSSTQFVRSERLGRLLTVIIESSLRGDTAGLKESVLGREAYDRGDDFDGRVDPIVRTEMRRLRRKLLEYYDSTGRADPVVIEIPKGKYVPSFRTRNEFTSRLQGETLGTYEVVERLAAGPSGITYRVIDPATGNEFAVKHLYPHITARPGVVDSLQADVRAAAGLQPRSACRIEEVEQTPDGVLLRSKYYEGITLEERLLSGELLWPECEEIARQLLSALASAHKSGIVHGRLKPSDILLSNTDGTTQVKILNFGSRPLAARIVIRPDWQQLGTPGFACSHASASEDSDVRSAGAILCQLFTRALPVHQAQGEVLVWPFTADVPQGFREGLTALIKRCLISSASDHFSDAGAVADACSRILEHNEESPNADTTKPVGTLKSVAKRWASALGLT